MPIQVDVDVHEVARLVADFDSTVANAKRRVVDEMRDLGPTVIRTAKRLVPKDTRALERSLDFTVNAREAAIRFGPFKRSINPKTGRPASSYYAYVHGGTVRMPARPFMVRAIRKHTSGQSKFVRGVARAGVGDLDRSPGSL